LSSASEKTEQPTAKRLRDAREKGQVAKSPEVPAAGVVMCLALYLIVWGGDIGARLLETADAIFSLAYRPYEEVLGLALSLAGNLLLSVLGPLIPIVVAASLMCNLGQVGVLFSAEAALPKLENLSPAKWFKKTFSRHNAFELLKNVVKVIVLGAVVYKLLSRHWAEMFSLSKSSAMGVSIFFGETVIRLVLWTAAAFCVIAAVDFVYQRFKYTKDNMMTKDEVKREYKEMEGDPLIKGKRRQLQREMATQAAVSLVGKAKFLVTNPTRYAVALDYEQGRTPLPLVLAKGEGEMARRMIAEAKRLGIPVLREASLARDLFEMCPEFTYIPKSLIAPVAEVLRWLNSMEGAR
jgi:type III secretion protein U